MDNSNKKVFEILLVEDDPGDARLTSEGFKKMELNHHLTIATDGEKALDCLHQKGSYSQSPLPDLVLLDLNLPKVNGHEVLQEMKNNPRLKLIPVVILSSSSSEEDIFRSYQAYANCYITKPNSLAQYFEAIRSIGSFWFDSAKLPLVS